MSAITRTFLVAGDEFEGRLRAKTCLWETMAAPPSGQYVGDKAPAKSAKWTKGDDYMTLGSVTA